MTAEEKLDNVTDEIIDGIEAQFYKMKWPEDGIDIEQSRVEIRRTLRDSCSELWEESAAEVALESIRLRAETLVETIREGDMQQALGWAKDIVKMCKGGK